MGAVNQSRRVGGSERRLLWEVDPELAAIKDQEERERIRQNARRERRGRRMPQVHPKSIQEEREENEQRVRNDVFWFFVALLIVVLLVMAR